MIPGHFALKQIMHNKAEFVITVGRHVSTSQCSGSRELIELWLKVPLRGGSDKGSASAWEYIGLRIDA